MVASPVQIVQLPMFTDNYVFLICDPVTRLAAVVDPGDADVVDGFLSSFAWTLSAILLTHHHADHAGGAQRLAKQTGAKIYGFTGDKQRLPPLDHVLNDGDTISILGLKAEITHTPGHTLGHICYYFPDLHAVFCGDTLFSMGCGRLFEGSPAQMWSSLEGLKKLPDSTRVYCAHEYTAVNLAFSRSIMTSDKGVAAAGKRIDRLLTIEHPTVPMLIGDERSANLFLRADDPVVQGALGLVGNSPTEVFAELRSRKDHYS